MRIALFSPSLFKNFEEFSKLVSPHVKEGDKIITHSIDNFPAKFAAQNRIDLEIIFGNKGEENMAFNRAKRVIDSADKVLVITDLEDIMSLYEINSALSKGKIVSVEYFGFPQKLNDKQVNFTSLSGVWLRNDFPCTVSFKGVEYASVDAAMRDIVSRHKNCDYRHAPWLDSLPRESRNDLLKIMFSLQEQKFGDKNPAIRIKMGLQKAGIHLKNVDFWSKWMNIMFRKIQERESTQSN